MPIYALTLLILLSPIFAVAQAPNNPTPHIEIIKHSWSKERIGWEKDPFNATGEQFYTMRDRVANERRPRTALEERTARALKEEQSKPAPPPRYVFSYKVVVENGGPPIKEIDWDFVFTDASTGEELGRRQFTSVESIGAGKRKELTVLASAAPAQRISVYTLGKNERQGLVETIVVVAIRYSDGTSWAVP